MKAVEEDNRAAVPDCKEEEKFKTKAGEEEAQAVIPECNKDKAHKEGKFKVKTTEEDAQVAIPGCMEDKAHKEEKFMLALQLDAFFHIMKFCSWDTTAEMTKDKDLEEIVALYFGHHSCQIEKSLFWSDNRSGSKGSFELTNYTDASLSTGILFHSQIEYMQSVIRQPRTDINHFIIGPEEMPDVDSFVYGRISKTLAVEYKFGGSTKASILRATRHCLFENGEWHNLLPDMPCESNGDVQNEWGAVKTILGHVFREAKIEFGHHLTFTITTKLVHAADENGDGTVCILRFLHGKERYELIWKVGVENEPAGLSKSKVS